MACNHFEIRPRALDRHRIIHRANFPNLLHFSLENEDYQQNRITLLNSQFLITVVTHGTRRTKCGSYHPKIGCRITTRPIFVQLRKPPKTAWGHLPRNQLRMMMRLMSPITPQMMRRTRPVPRTRSRWMHSK
ncbi:hypothetical protein M9H77_21521 [Catharanthus roseus]|uniref:Uncharacterized protein n=1 Tax=Catharanthus roseus TaxID=4058 RepID=A0ACC0ARY5_CATRO|nr:hypothetical protein M9H77_21521 [Catharanthus roseus]